MSPIHILTTNILVFIRSNHVRNNSHALFSVYQTNPKSLSKLGAQFMKNQTQRVEEIDPNCGKPTSFEAPIA